MKIRILVSVMTVAIATACSVNPAFAAEPSASGRAAIIEKATTTFFAKRTIKLPAAFGVLGNNGGKLIHHGGGICDDNSSSCVDVVCDRLGSFGCDDMSEI